MRGGAASMAVEQGASHGQHEALSDNSGFETSWWIRKGLVKSLPV